MKKDLQVVGSNFYLTNPSQKSHLPTIPVLLLLWDYHDYSISILM